MSVRGQRYQTALTLDELEAMLERFGFFRCHRSYIVNVQKVAKLNGSPATATTSPCPTRRSPPSPLAKGRVTDMREHFGL